MACWELSQRGLKVQLGPFDTKSFYTLGNKEECEAYAKQKEGLCEHWHPHGQATLECDQDGKSYECGSVLPPHYLNYLQVMKKADSSKNQKCAPALRGFLEGQRGGRFKCKEAV